MLASDACSFSSCRLRSLRISALPVCTRGSNSMRWRSCASRTPFTAAACFTSVVFKNSSSMRSVSAAELGGASGTARDDDARARAPPCSGGIEPWILSVASSTQAAASQGSMHTSTDASMALAMGNSLMVAHPPVGAVSGGAGWLHASNTVHGRRGEAPIGGDGRHRGRHGGGRGAGGEELHPLQRTLHAIEQVAQPAHHPPQEEG